MQIPQPVDPKAIPSLQGVYEPVPDERDAADLTVIGEIPSDLRGAYLRNGPNPLFTPLGSWTYPLDGDGMIHGIWIDEDGTVRYRNRFVWTSYLCAERDAGTALWSGIMTPYIPGPDTVPASLDNTLKPLPDINVVRHAGRWLALAETDPPWEISGDLDTIGTSPFTWGGAIPGMCAHPKFDPTTGEMVLFRYNLEEPYLVWASIGADGAVVQPPVSIEIDGAYMIHDFVITERYVVLFVGPAYFDLEAFITGVGEPLSWRPEKGLRIAVVPRTGVPGTVRWIETEAFWVWHFANAFEEGGQIVVDFSRFSELTLGPGAQVTGGVTRARLDAAAGTIVLDTLDDRLTEFPRIDDRLTGRQHRHFSVSTKSTPGGPGTFDTLLRFDTARGSVEEWNSGTKLFGEVVFAPAHGGDPERGYLVTFRTDRETLCSDWIVLDASDIAAGPVAVVDMPFRVPAGLHGNWFPSAD